MKKIFFLPFIATMLCLAQASAQVYTTAMGLQSDFTNSYTLMIGPAIKHQFGKSSAIEGDMLFGRGGVTLQGFYQVQEELVAKTGLQGYVGAGPSLSFYKGGTSFYLRPIAGLDYKINNVPLAVSFDWRPFIYLGNTYGSRFTAKSFGIGIKYAAK